MIFNLNFKHIMLISIFGFLTIKPVQAQFSRSFHSANGTEKTRSNIAYEYNNEMYVLSVKESSNTGLKAAFIKINDQGDVESYNYLSSSNYGGTNHLINGYYVSGDTLLISLFYKETSLSRSALIKINLTNHSIIDEFLYPETLNNGYAQALVKGDSLIAYYSINNTNVNRFAHSISNFGTYNTSLVTTSLFVAGDYNLGTVASDLIVINDEEFVVFKTLLVKRDALGVYTNVTMPFSAQSTGYSLVHNSDNNHISLFRRNLYAEFDLNLNLITNGDLGFVTIHNMNEAYFDNGNYYYYINLNNDNLKKYTISSNFQIIDTSEMRDQNSIYGVYKNGSNYYLYGGKVEPMNLFYLPDGTTSTSMVSDLLIKNNPSDDLLVFGEYVNELKHENQYLKFGHLNRILFDGNYAGPSFTYEHNGAESSMAFFSKQVFTASMTGSIKGVTANYAMDSILPGPITSNGQNSYFNIDTYNRGYYVDKQMIHDHQVAITQNTPNYVAPFGIREWPAHGNTSIGQAENIAHFYDSNNNGIYEPQLGDYPSIYGDRCILYVYNFPETATNGAGVEAHQYNFVFDCDTSEVIKNTVFISTYFVNRSANNYSDVKVGTFLDTDMGNYADDYIGTNVNLGMVYGYNGDGLDESNGSINFSDTLPALGLLILKGAKLSNDGLDNAIGVNPNESINGLGYNDGIDDNEYIGLSASRGFNGTSNFPAADPTTVAQTNQVLLGNYSDGSPINYGVTQIHHVYFGDTDPNFYSSNGIAHPNDYSEQTVNNPAGDRRIIASSGGNSLLNSGDTLHYITAYISTIDSMNVGDINAPVQKLFSMGSELKNMFDLNNPGCALSFHFYESPFSVGLNEMNQEESLSIYPNPTSETLTINGLDNSALLTVLSLNGIQLLSKQISNGEEVDLSFLPKSIYILKIETSKGVITKRIVKN